MEHNLKDLMDTLWKSLTKLFISQDASILIQSRRSMKNFTSFVRAFSVFLKANLLTNFQANSLQSIYGKTNCLKDSRFKTKVSCKEGE
jgi:hypothetical protein